MKFKIKRCQNLFNHDFGGALCYHILIRNFLFAMIKKYTREIIITLIFAVVLFGSILGVNIYKKSHPQAVPVTKDILTGVVTDVAASARVITITDANNHVYSLATVEATQFLDKDNKTISFKDIYKGFTIKAVGTSQESDILLPESIQILEQPNIIVYAPVKNSKVSNYFIVKGIARTFENTFSIRLKDATNGQTYFEKSFMTKNGAMGQYGDINSAISLGDSVSNINDKANLLLEVFEYSAKDGSEINKATVPLVFSKPFTSTTNNPAGANVSNVEGIEESVNIYFNNNQLDPNISCNKVFPVTRKLILNDDFDRTVRLVLEQLFFGPTQQEITDHYSTSLPVNVKINNVSLNDGELKVDFDNQLQAGIGGSCRVAAIRAQLTETLMDLPGVDSVILSINGNMNDILQP